MHMLTLRGLVPAMPVTFCYSERHVAVIRHSRHTVDRGYVQRVDLRHGSSTRGTS